MVVSVWNQMVSGRVLFLFGIIMFRNILWKLFKYRMKKFFLLLKRKEERDTVTYRDRYLLSSISKESPP